MKAGQSAQFSPDGQRVVTASWDNTARVWDAATGKPMAEPMKHRTASIQRSSVPMVSGGDRLLGQHGAGVGCRQR